MRKLCPILFCSLLLVSNAFPLTIDSHRYGTRGFDSLAGIILDEDGLLLVGNSLVSNSSDYPDLYAERVGLNGSSLWSHTFSYAQRDDAVGVLPIPTGGYLLYGATNAQNNGNCQALVVRMGEDGTVLWSRQFGQNGDDMFAAAVTVADGCLLAGHTRETKFAKSDIVLAKLSPEGVPLWLHFYGGQSDEICNFAVPHPNGSILLGGFTRSWDTVSADLLLLLVDENGQQLNLVHQYSELATWAVDAVATENGFVVTGTTFSDSTLERPCPFLMHVDLSGEPSQMFLLDDSEPFWVNTLERAGSGFFFLGGQAYFSNQGAMRLIGPDGTLIHEAQDTYPGWDSINDLVWDNLQQILYFAGESYVNETNGYDFFYGSLQRDLENIFSRFVPRLEAPSTSTLDVYPNPFNASATLRVQLEHNANLELVLYDVLGREALRLVDDRLNAGTHQFSLDGRRMASGVYFLESTLDGTSQPVRKITLVR